MFTLDWANQFSQNLERSTDQEMEKENLATDLDKLLGVLKNLHDVSVDFNSFQLRISTVWYHVVNLHDREGNIAGQFVFDRESGKFVKIRDKADLRREEQTHSGDFFEHS